MDDIVPGAAGGIPAALGQEADVARGYAAASRAASTRLIYDADWQRFQTWCAARSVPPLPADPAAVAQFCAGEAEAGRAPSTITRRLAAIGWAHKRAGHKPPQHADGARGDHRGHGRHPAVARRGAGAKGRGRCRCAARHAARLRR